jgi:GH15 family glucan-1,4-alpha-glucosidase
MVWVAFDRAVKAVEEYGLEGPVDLWRQIRASVHQQGCREGFDSRRRTFTQYFGSKPWMRAC